MSSDIFKEDPHRSCVLNSSLYIRIKVSGVFGSFSFASITERLAWVSGKKEINFSKKRLSAEGFKVRPNRCRSQYTLFHLLNQVPDDEGFDLHISCGCWMEPTKLSTCSFKSSFEATHSWTKAEYSG